MVTGNIFHDDVFDHEGINVAVDEAVEIAGEQCGMASKNWDTAMNNADELVLCLEVIMESNWNCKLDSFSLTEVRHILPFR